MSKVRPAAEVAGGGPPDGRQEHAVNLLLAASKAPEIDYQGLAPVLALVGGAVAVLMVGPVPRQFVQRVPGARGGGRVAAQRRSA